MKLAGETNKDKAQQLRSLLPIGKQVRVSFSKHSDTTLLKDVVLGVQSQIKALPFGNIPAKRTNADGKQYTPPLVSLIFENFRMNIVLEDIEVYQRIGGVTLKTPQLEIEIKET